MVDVLVRWKIGESDQAISRERVQRAVEEDSQSPLASDLEQRPSSVRSVERATRFQQIERKLDDSEATGPVPARGCGVRLFEDGIERSVVLGIQILGKRVRRDAEAANPAPVNLAFQMVERLLDRKSTRLNSSH